MAGEEEQPMDDEEPPLRRRRLSPEQDDAEYSPSVAPPSPDVIPIEENEVNTDPPLLPAEVQDETVSIDLTEFMGSPQNREPTATEPSVEPSAPPTVPATPVGNSAQTLANLGLDPQFASLYEIAGPESFRQHRLRMDRQETFRFGPSRMPRQNTTHPYPPQHLDTSTPVPIPHSTTSTTTPPEPTSTTEPPTSVPPGPSSLPQSVADIPVLDEEELYSQAFEVQGISENDIPLGWRLDASGYFQLDEKMQDYWELRAGCLIRHHLVPRRKLFRLNTVKDCPMRLEQLDVTRITLIRAPTGNYTPSSLILT